MLDVTLKITLTLKGPILTKSTSPGAFGVDSAFARDESKRLVLPRGLIKGRLKQSVDEQENLGVGFKNYWSTLLGGGPDGDFEPHRGRLDFSRFVYTGDATLPDPKTRISIDPDRGAANDGALQVLETLVPSGADAVFDGTIRFYAECKDIALEIRKEVLRAFSFITNFGSDKSIGFGELSKVVIDDPITRPMTSARSLGGSATAPTVLDVMLTPESPFCLAKAGPDKNVFESDTIISGGTIKACVATTWLHFWGLTGSGAISDDRNPPPPGKNDYPDLCRNFERIRFTHAFPARRDNRKRPVAIPYSVVAVGKDDLRDVSDWKDAGLIGGESPAFCMDWKRKAWKEAETKFGWDFPDSVFEVRNSHDRTRRKAGDDKLFSYEMVDPQRHVWLGQVDFSRVSEAERPTVTAQFRHLLDCLGELRFLGKTKSRMKLEILEQPFKRQFDSGPLTGDRIIVTLQTPAILCDPASLNEESGEEKLRAFYADVWTQISGGTLELENYFARQHLAGGEYLKGRFMKGRPYNPFLLTDAGSVFVLRPTGKPGPNGETFESVIKGWLGSGLPVPDWAKAINRCGDSWETNPYIPENGFGEIAVNLPTHKEMKAVGGKNGK